MPFSNSKQDVCCKFTQRMDALSELVRFERYELIGLESASVCLFLWLLSFGQAKESDSPSGETTDW